MPGSVSKVVEAATRQDVIVLMLPANDANAMLAHAILANGQCRNVSILLRRWPGGADDEQATTRL